MRLLLIEDNELTRDAAADLLRREGHEVDTLPSALGALSRLVQTRPDALLLDLVLPGVSGLSLLETLDADPALRLPVLMTTAAPDAVVDDLTARWPGLKVLRKPYEVSELRAALESLCPRKETP